MFTGQVANITTDSSDISDITTQDPSEIVKQILNMDLVRSNTEIKSEPLVISISSTYLGMDTLNSDPQEEAVKQKLDILEKNTGSVINQDIFTSVYDGKVGYTFVIHNPTSHTLESFTFVETYDYTYNIHILGMVYNPNTADDIKKILDSIKFFD